MMELFAIKITVCFILSFLIGLERQWQRRITGIRTNVLVSLGACLFTIVNVKIGIDSDMTRIAAQVVCGIGFLGAGVIIKDGTHIKGLNTAATLWCTAAIGVLCAYGYLEEAIIGTAYILLANVLLRALGFKMSDSLLNDSSFVITLICKQKNASGYRKEIIEWIEKNRMIQKSIEQNELKANDVELIFIVDARNSVKVQKLVSKLSTDQNISSVSWNIYNQAPENNDI